MLVQSLLRMEVACFLVLVFVSVVYFTAKRKKTHLHKYFSGALVMLMIHLVFDGITVYTVNNMDTVSPFVNDTMHRIYLMTMLGTLVFLYKYVSRLIYEETGEKSSKLGKYIRYMLNIYAILAEILLLVTPVSYVETPKGNYESGIGKAIIFISVTLFMLHMISNMIINIKHIHPRKSLVIIVSFAIELTGAIWTAIDNTMLLAGLGYTLMVLAIFLTLENPDIKLVEQVREEKHKADEANELKSKFLSVVSHEMRTPMNAVVGMTDILLKENPTERQKKFLSNIQSSGKALVLLLNDILDLSKIEAGKLQIIEQPYKPQPILDDVKMIIENRIGNKPIKLIYDIDDKMPSIVYGDGLRIRQILINLLNNAVKFTEEGEIRLTIKQLSVDENGMFFKFSVKDTGQGIRQEDLCKLFKAFSQVDQEKNHGKEGTGMGLFISSDLIALMGGQLEVASEYGEWTEFFFTIHQGFADKIETTKNNDNDLNISGLHVLVVDDAEINLEIAKEIFEMFEVKVDTAESGYDALKLLETNRYDIIFTDYIMPEMNGTEFTDNLRKLSGEYFEKVPVIALTGDTSDEVRTAFKEAGVSDFIEKPVNADKLYKITANWIEKIRIKN